MWQYVCDDACVTMQWLSYPHIENFEIRNIWKKIFIITFFSTFFTIKLSTGHLRHWSMPFSLTLSVPLGRI